MQLVFAECALGSLVLTANAILLGGEIVFFQAVCLMGYCLFPICISAIVCATVGNKVGADGQLAAHLSSWFNGLMVHDGRVFKSSIRAGSIHAAVSPCRSPTLCALPLTKCHAPWPPDAADHPYSRPGSGSGMVFCSNHPIHWQGSAPRVSVMGWNPHVEHRREEGWVAG